MGLPAGALVAAMAALAKAVYWAASLAPFCWRWVAAACAAACSSGAAATWIPRLFSSCMISHAKWLGSP